MQELNSFVDMLLSKAADMITIFMFIDLLITIHNNTKKK